MVVKVSIIVPIYNSELYLDRCLKSIVNQTLTDIEIILVDDASTDKSPIICDEWAKKDSRIQVVHKAINQGLGMARNTGLKYASGEYFTFVDSDDYIDKETYNTAFQTAIDGNYDVVYYQFRRFPFSRDLNHIESVKTFDNKEEIRSFQLYLLGPLPSENVDFHYSMSVCMGIFNMAIIKETGLKFMSEREVASEDMIFHMQFLPYVSRVCMLPNCFYNYFINPHSITTTYSIEKRNRLLKLLETERKILDEQYDWESYRLHYFSEQLRILRVLMKYECRFNCSLLDKYKNIKSIVNLPLFKELLKDNYVVSQPIKKFLLFLLKHRMYFTVIFLYSLNKKN